MEWVPVAPQSEAGLAHGQMLVPMTPQTRPDGKKRPLLTGKAGARAGPNTAREPAGARFTAPPGRGQGF